MSGLAGGFLQGLGGGMQKQQARALKERELSAMEALGRERQQPQQGMSLPMDVGPQGAMPGGQRPSAGLGSGKITMPQGNNPQQEARVIQGLISRGMPAHIAKGVAANMIAESRLDSGINEISPVVPGSRGGFGYNQWTGPRRVALEAEAARRGVPVNDHDFQLDYTMYELQGAESRAWKALQGTQTAEEAARVYSEQFLRPGVPHLENRIAHARRLEAAHRQSTQPKQDEAPQTWAWARNMTRGAGR